MKLAAVIYGSTATTIETERLAMRAPLESDRTRFVELFTDEAFTVFSYGVHDVDSANARFDRMLAVADTVPYAKQPVIERFTGITVGYTGVGRGRGFATEATAALLDVADDHDDGEMLCIVAADNSSSRRVADKVGFRWWRRRDWQDDPTGTYDLLLQPVDAGGPPLLAPDAA